MKKRFNLVWITGLILGWLFDLLFWKQALGNNFAIYSILCLSGGFLILNADKQYAARRSLVLVPFILLFAALTSLRTEPMTQSLGVLLTRFLMLLLTNTFLGGRWLWYGLVDYFNACVRIVASMIVRPLALSAEVSRERAQSGIARNKLSVWPFLRGMAIALPILAVFTALFASADAAFNKDVNIFLNYLAIQNLPQYIFRMAYILVVAYSVVGVILHASTQSRDEKLIGDDKPILPPFLGFTESTIVLGSVAILFITFVIVQFEYFFGGQANITVAGFTYAEYARRGFGELVTVALFSLIMLLGFDAVTRRDSRSSRRLFLGLSMTIVALVIVMLVSAYQRLVLYETAYGFSRLRTYTHVALIWIGLLLVTVAVLEILQRQRFFPAMVLIAAVGFTLSLAGLNVDGLIVKENVNRVLQGQELDVSYLASLSSDSVPPLAEIYQALSTTNRARDAVGAVLFCRVHAKGDSLGSDWRSSTISSWFADSTMQRVARQLDGYKVLDESWPTRIITPVGAIYACHGGGED